MAQYDYPLDTNGDLATNKITSERHTITAVNNRNYNFLIPKFAPYHAPSMRVYLEEGNTLMPLAQGSDWNYAMEFSGATLATGKPIYGAVSFNNLNFSGQVIIEYQTLGGEYTLAIDKLTEVIANIIYNPRGVTWEEIVGLPSMFPPIDHPWNFDDMVGMTEVKESLDEIAHAILARSGGNIDDHLRDFNNPHQTTKHQIELGNVENFPPATIAQGIAGLSNSALITPMVLRAVVEELGLLNLSEAIDEFRRHLTVRDNPHETTKAQVQLGHVENLPVASPSDILAKRKVRKYVTLDQLMEYLALHGCKPTDNPELEHPPKNALLSVYCNNLNRMGIYADGIGGSYEKIIEIDSRDCGYVPPKPTQHPVNGTILSKYCIGVDQFHILADGVGGTFSRPAQLNSPDCGYTGPVDHPAAGTVLATRCDGKTLIKTVANGTGGSTEQREENSSSCTSPTPSHPPADTLLSTQCQGFDLRGTYADGTGGTYTAVVERNSANCGYRPPAPPTPPAPPPPPPPPPYVPPPPPPPVAQVSINISFDRSAISVGQTARLTTNISGLTAGRSYTITYYKTTSSGNFIQYYNSLSFTANDSTTSSTFNVDNNGDVIAGTYRFKAVLSGGASKESNILNLQYNANRSISLTLNGNSSSLTAYVGDNITVAYSFRDFPIYGSATETQPLPYYLEIRGADSRNAGEGTFTIQTNSVGSANASFTNTLLANDSITGSVTYRIVSNWKDLDGNMQTTASNAVTINWVRRAAPPPPYVPPPPAASNEYQTHQSGEPRDWWMTANVTSRNVDSSGFGTYGISGRINSPFAGFNELKYFSIRYNSHGANVVWTRNAAAFNLDPDQINNIYRSSYYDTITGVIGGTDGAKNWSPKFAYGATLKAGITVRGDISLVYAVINKDGSFSASVRIDRPVYDSP